MKGILEFDLNNIDDVIKFKRYNKSDDMAYMLFDLLSNLRKNLMFSLENKDLDKYETLEMVFEKISELANEHNINLDEIII